jgi:hypothetical protein
MRLDVARHRRRRARAISVDRRRQRPQAELRERRVRPPVRPVIRAMRGHDHHARAVGARHGHLQHVARGIIEPVQVLDDHHHRHAATCSMARDRVEAAVPSRRLVVWAALARQRQHPAQILSPVELAAVGAGA